MAAVEQSITCTFMAVEATDFPCTSERRREEQGTRRDPSRATTGKQRQSFLERVEHQPPSLIRGSSKAGFELDLVSCSTTLSTKGSQDQEEPGGLQRHGPATTCLDGATAVPTGFYVPRRRGEQRPFCHWTSQVSAPRRGQRSPLLSLFGQEEEGSSFLPAGYSAPTHKTIMAEHEQPLG